MKATREEQDKKLFYEYKNNKVEFLKFLSWKSANALRELQGIKAGRRLKGRRHQQLKWTFRGLKWFKEDVPYNDNFKIASSGVKWVRKKDRRYGVKDEDIKKPMEVNKTNVEAEVVKLRREVEELRVAILRINMGRIEDAQEKVQRKEMKSWKDEAMDISKVMKFKQKDIVKIAVKGKEKDKTDEDLPWSPIKKADKAAVADVRRNDAERPKVKQVGEKSVRKEFVEDDSTDSDREGLSTSGDAFMLNVLEKELEVSKEKLIDQKLDVAKYRFIVMQNEKPLEERKLVRLCG